MAHFSYRALKSDGEVISGLLQADSLESAKEILRRQELMVTKLIAVSKKTKKSPFSKTLLIAFTRDMAQLLQAGLPVYESLMTIEEKYKGSKAHGLFLDLIEEIRTGQALSFAVRKYPEIFDPVYAAMLSCAEKSGALAEAFQELHKLLVRQNRIKKQMIASLTYPLLLGCFCLIVMGVLFLFVVPSISELFEGRDLHPITKAVLAISNFLRTSGSFLVGGLAALSIFIFFSLKNPKGKETFYRFLQKLPLVKNLLLLSSLQRFARTLALLIGSGTSLVEALVLSSKVAGHPLMEKVIEKGVQKVIEGQNLSKQFMHPLVPPLVYRMMAIAEETGKMSPMLYSLSEIYEEELERSLTQITTLLQPLLLLLLGVMVGFVVLAILLPMTDAGSFTTL